MFYTYIQNNSGGWFAHDDAAGIGYAVIVEAKSAAEANARAEQIGLYFNGDNDCECCGSRWSEQYDDVGDDVPKLYSETVEESQRDTSTLGGWWGLPVFVHYLDGRVVRHVHVELEEIEDSED